MRHPSDKSKQKKDIPQYDDQVVHHQTRDILRDYGRQTHKNASDVEIKATKYAEKSKDIIEEANRDNNALNAISARGDEIIEKRKDLKTQRSNAFRIKTPHFDLRTAFKATKHLTLIDNYEQSHIHQHNLDVDEFSKDVKEKIHTNNLKGKESIDKLPHISSQNNNLIENVFIPEGNIKDVKKHQPEDMTVKTFDALRNITKKPDGLPVGAQRPITHQEMIENAKPIGQWPEPLPNFVEDDSQEAQIASDIFSFKPPTPENWNKTR
jgi:hypothetical protein